MTSFILYLKEIKRYSPHTLRAYEQDIQQFFTYAEKDRLPLERDSVRGFVTSIFLKTHSKATVSRKIYSLKSFFNYLIKNNIIQNNPAENIPLPKEQKLLPKILDEEEIRGFLDNFPDKTFLDLRDKTIFELLYATGLRISELTGLTCPQINFPAGLIKILGKGHKERIIPVHDKALATLKTYCESRKSRTRPSETALFVNARGSGLTSRSVERILINRFREITGSNRSIYPHLFRHSFASHLLQRGANLRVIQELLGHSRLSTTQQYTSLNFSDLLESYRKHHPRENDE